MEKQFRCTQFRTIPRNYVKFREYLIASLFAITAQFCAMKWRKRLSNSVQRNSDCKPYSQVIKGSVHIFYFEEIESLPQALIFNPFIFSIQRPYIFQTVNLFRSNNL